MNPRPHVWLLTACASVTVLAIFTTAVHADETASLSSPQWLWTSAERVAPSQACFHTMFETEGQAVTAARLVAAADFCTAQIVINGQPVGQILDHGPSLDVDVVGQLQRGENHLAVSCTNTLGPAAVLIRLTLRLADGSTRTIGSDPSWRTLAGGTPDWRDPQLDVSRWSRAASFGSDSTSRSLASAAGIEIDELDDYTQWMRALGSEQRAAPPSFLVAKGFQIELVHTAGADEGSWVSLEFDGRGRLIVAREDRGLLRMTLSERGEVTRVETINDSLLECRGLLWAHDCLYVHANNSKGLYRLRDIDGDDRFDEVKLLRETSGDVGHGRNDLALGPDGMVYAMFGDSVEIPRDVTDHTSPFREHRRGESTSEGFVLRTDRDGTSWEVVAAGLRNPYGIDFNTDGEPFTYDADAEFDMGASWYRPTRVAHLVTGADFGWRGVTGSWPPYFPDHPDNGVPSLDIGKGSPTGVKFGTRSNFPAAYRRALFILDWAYGRILAVHMTPHGASYRCTAESFIKGKPLNVTDLGFGPDGAMYVVTGGRKTQAGLYRIRYVGPAIAEPAMSPQELARTEYSRGARSLRKQLETAYNAEPGPVLRLAWPELSNPDPWLCAAARTAIERQPVAAWSEQLESENRPAAVVAALLMLARSPGGGPVDRLRVLERLNAVPLVDLPHRDKLAALYIYELCLREKSTDNPPAAARGLPSALLEAIAARLTPLISDDSSTIPRQVSTLLVQLGAPGAVEHAMSRLQTATDPVDVLHCLFVVRNECNGWTPDLRRTFVRAWQSAQQSQGGQGMPGFLEKIRSEALSAMPKDQQGEFSSLFSAAQPESLPLVSRPVVRKWTVAELVSELSQENRSADLERGREMFEEAMCARCHRVGSHGTLIGPDLTAAGRRFDRHDLLQSIVTPSRVVADSYRSVRVVTNDGRVLTGRIVPAGDYRATAIRIATDLTQPGRTTDVEKKLIDSHETLATSWMPEGLLDTLSAAEVRDLLGYIESGGRPQRARQEAGTD